MKKENKIESDLRRLTKAQVKIYDAIRRYFPATSHDCAMDAAMLNGIKFQFYPK